MRQYPFTLIKEDPESIAWKDYARREKLVDAIKSLREQERERNNTTLNLKQAKDVVEEYVNEYRTNMTTVNVVRLNNGDYLRVFGEGDQYSVEHVRLMPGVKTLTQVLQLVADMNCKQ